MNDYIDGFVFPIPRDRLAAYQRLAEEVAKIWRAHGALDYQEFVGDDLALAGTRSFIEAAQVEADEVVVFGWVTFASRESRDQANELVAADPRMASLVDAADTGFDATRMLYGGFQAIPGSSSP